LLTRATCRRRVLLAPLFGVLLLAGCDSTPPLRTDFPALTYDYLPVLHLSVASMEIENRATLVANDFSPQSPVLPTDALTRMAGERLQASGNSGKAVFVIDQASLVRTRTGLLGNFAVHIDVQSADHQHVAYASAKVTRSYTGDLDDVRGTLYDMTKQMMDDMNVELEVQVRRTLGDWLQNVSTAPREAPVQSQSLTPTPDAATPPSQQPNEQPSQSPDLTPAPPSQPIPLQPPAPVQ
jgi:hypothetical protein